MNTREHFKKQGLKLNWGRSKVVIEVGRDRDKIVCSPKAFRYLKRAIEALNDIGYMDPLIEGEMLDAQIRDSKSRKDRRDGTVREEKLRAAVPYLDEFDVQAISQWPARQPVPQQVLGRWEDRDANVGSIGRREPSYLLCTPEQEPVLQQLIARDKYGRNLDGSRVEDHPQYDEAGYLVDPEET